MKTIAQTIRLDLRDFFTLAPQVRFLLIFQLIVLFILSILVGIIFSPKFKGSVQSRSGVPLYTSPTAIPEKPISLSVQPELETMRVGQTQSINVQYRGPLPGAIDAILIYNQDVLEVDVIKNAQLFDVVLRSQARDNRIYFSGAMSPEALEEQEEVEIDSTVFTFVVTALAAGESNIEFLEPESIVAHEGHNILNQMHSKKITVND